MRRVFLCAVVLLVSASAFAQQDYVGRFNAFGGYSFLDSPNSICSKMASMGRLASTSSVGLRLALTSAYSLEVHRWWQAISMLPHSSS